MADLISASEKNEIFSALRGVTDTFFKETVKYLSNKVPHSNTGRASRTNTDQDLLCRVTVLDGSEGEVENKYIAKEDEAELSIAFNKEYLDEQGASFDPIQGQFQWQGVVYDILLIHADDSDFMGDDVLVVVECKKTKPAP